MNQDKNLNPSLEELGKIIASYHCARHPIPASQLPDSHPSNSQAKPVDQAAEDFARYLRTQRNKARLTQQELADKADLSATTIFALEQGLILSTIIRTQTLQKLADALTLEVAHLALMLDHPIPTRGVMKIFTEVQLTWAAVVAYFGSPFKAMAVLAVMICTLLSTWFYLGKPIRYVKYMPSLHVNGNDSGLLPATTTIPDEMMIVVLILLGMWLVIWRGYVPFRFAPRAFVGTRKIIYATAVALVIVLSMMPQPSTARMPVSNRSANSPLFRSGNIDITAKKIYNCVLTGNAVKCWVHNYQGQLGMGNIVSGISVTPMAFSATLLEGQSHTLSLNIHNEGNANLTYQINKQDTTTIRVAQAQPMTWPTDKIDADLQESLDDHGQASFLVYLKGQADLDDASQILDRAKRRQQVYETLRNTAQGAQADLLAWLDKQQVAGHVTDYRSFFLVNAIGMTADRAAVDALAYRDDVAYLELESTFTIPEPEESGLVSAAAVHGIEPGLLKIKANEVWSTLGIRGNGITVGIIDTGVEHTHPALKEQYRGTATGNHDFNWYDATGRFPDTPGDVGGHGTHVAGTIVGSDGGRNQIGVAPGAQWIAARACNPRGQGGCTSFDLLNALQWMLAPCPIGVEPGDDDNKELCDPSKSPDLVSNSWGSGGGGERGYATVVNNLRKAGIMLIFAAGNDGEYGDSTHGYSPGGYASSIAVGAVDGASQWARLSRQGPSRITSEIKPDISAPGVDIRSAGLNGQYVYNRGTSMATPHLAGVVALMLEASPKLTPEQIEMILKNTATDLGELGPDYQYGYGLINAYAAVQAVTSVQPWLTYQPGQGTIKSNKSREIKVTLNAAGLTPGSHTMDTEMLSGWNAEVFPPLEGNNGVSALMSDAHSQNAPFEEVAYWDTTTGTWVSRQDDVSISNFSIFNWSIHDVKKIIWRVVLQLMLLNTVMFFILVIISLIVIGEGKIMRALRGV